MKAIEESENNPKDGTGEQGEPNGLLSMFNLDKKPLISNTKGKDNSAPPQKKAILRFTESDEDDGASSESI
jgi:hypothetical protein